MHDNKHSPTAKCVTCITRSQQSRSREPCRGLCCDSFHLLRTDTPHLLGRGQVWAGVQRGPHLVLWGPQLCQGRSVQAGWAQSQTQVPGRHAHRCFPHCSQKPGLLSQGTPVFGRVHPFTRSPRLTPPRGRARELRTLQCRLPHLKAA